MPPITDLVGRVNTMFSHIWWQFEIHVPERPVVRFSHVKLPLGISEHDLGKRLPRKTGEIPSTHVAAIAHAKSVQATCTWLDT